MKVFSELVNADLEHLTADPTPATTSIGRIWVRTDTSPIVAKFSDGTSVRTFVTADNIQTLTNKSLSDSTTYITDNSDATKIAQFQCSGITTATTRTFTFPDANLTFVGLDTTQTLTNKTISSASNTLTLLDSTTTIKDNADTSKVLAFECSGITTATTRTWTVIDRNGSVVVSSTPTTTKGDILVDTGTALVRQAIGTDNHVLTADSAQTNGLKWAAQTAAPVASYKLTNLGLATSVAASALTVSLKQADGSTNPAAGTGAVTIGFRDSTVTTGQHYERTVTAALSVVVPSTATLGFSGSSNTNYLYVYVIDNAGTVELGVSGVILDEGSVKTSTTIDTSSDSISGFYSTTGRTSKAIRLIGRIKFTLATAGTWDEAGDEVSLVPFQAQTPAGRFSGNAASAASGAPIIMPTTDYDTFNSYNASTGRYTIPITGIYIIDGYLSTASASVPLNLYIDASVSIYIGITSAGNVTVLSGQASLTAGQVVDIRPNGSALDCDANSTWSLVRIGPTLY